MGSILMEPVDVASYARIYLPGENSSSICIPIGMINSRGVFQDENPLDHSIPLLQAQLALASMVILFTSYFLKPLGQPSMVIQIVGGLILGPSFLGRIAGFIELVYPFKGLEVLDTLASFGYMIYFFLIGVQLDPWILKKIDRKHIHIGFSTVFFATILSITASFLLLRGEFPVDRDIAVSLLAVAVSSSMISFPIIAHYLTELKMVNSEFGRMALSSSLISNLFAFGVMTFTIIANPSGGEMYAAVKTIVSGLVLVMAITFVIRPIILWQLRRIPEGGALKQSFIYMIFVGILMTGFCSKAMGLNIFFGPLVYGMAIPAGPPLGSALMDKLDLVTRLFMPLYFVKNGLVTDIFSVKVQNYLLVQCIIVLACIGKFSGAVMASVYNKLPLKEAIQIGLVMNVQGVLDLGMFKMMKQNGVIKEESFIIMCISMLVVTATITPILRHLYDPLRRHEFHLRRTVMDLTPNSELQIVACVHNQVDVPTMINLIKSFHPTRQSPIELCLMHLVELVGRAHPILIPHKLHNVNSQMAPTSRSIVNAFNLLQESYRGVVKVYPFTAISSYTTMHDEVCELAFDSTSSLIITPFHRRSARSEMVQSSEAGIKDMNDKILERAPCSVAIVVDRGATTIASRSDTEASTSFRIAVFFIGGPHDREALAIGARMAAHPNISLTIVRLVPNTNDVVEDADETAFDNDITNEMRRQLAGNMRVAYKEEVVRDGMGTVAVIRTMDDHYDLIIVGRYHNTRSPLMLGLSEWGEGSELGAVGDMFVLADSNSNSTVLIVQQNYEFPGGYNDIVSGVY